MVKNWVMTHIMIFFFFGWLSFLCRLRGTQYSFSSPNEESVNTHIQRRGARSGQPKAYRDFCRIGFVFDIRVALLN
jgi:hypothetical protein